MTSPADSGALTGSTDSADSGPAVSGRVDVHQHAMTPAAREWLVGKGLLPPVGGPPWARWSLESTLDLMDSTGVDVGVMSGPTPAEFLVGMDSPTVAEITRLGNESMAEIVRDHPTRFGFFAFLPLSHVDVALAELEYSFDTLGADGVALTNQARDAYLGDPAFEPVFAELDRRGAVAFTHPFNLPGCSPALVATFLVDFLADTTRAAVNMVLTGTLERYPDVKVILPHGGGFFPYMASRLQLGAYLGAGVDLATASKSLERFYYDTAMPTSPHATPSLLAAVGADRILFGSDWPAATAEGAAYNARALDDDPALDPPTKQLVNRENALKLLPNVARRLGG